MTDLDPPWIDLFLRQLKSHGLINTAATTAGVSRRTVDRLREASAEFDYAVEDALEAAADELEMEARRRAVEGVEKGVYYKGDRVDTEVQYSDQLLTTLLKAKRADEFAERKQITGAGGAPLTVVVRSFGDSSAQQIAPQEPTVSSSSRAVASATGEAAIVDAEFRLLPSGSAASGSAAPSADLALADVLDMV